VCEQFNLTADIDEVLGDVLPSVTGRSRPDRAPRSNAQAKRVPVPDVGTRLHRRIQKTLGHASHGVILEPVEERPAFDGIVLEQTGPTSVYAYFLENGVTRSRMPLTGNASRFSAS